MREFICQTFKTNLLNTMVTMLRGDDEESPNPPLQLFFIKFLLRIHFSWGCGTTNKNIKPYCSCIELITDLEIILVAGWYKYSHACIKGVFVKDKDINVYFR